MAFKKKNGFWSAFFRSIITLPIFFNFLTGIVVRIKTRVNLASKNFLIVCLLVFIMFGLFITLWGCLLTLMLFSLLSLNLSILTALSIVFGFNLFVLIITLFLAINKKNKMLNQLQYLRLENKS